MLESQPGNCWQLCSHCSATKSQPKLDIRRVQIQGVSIQGEWLLRIALGSLCHSLFYVGDLYIREML